MTKKAWPFVLSLGGLAVSAALLILLIPSLFRSDGSDGWLVATLAVVAVACGAGGRRWRPPSSATGEH